MGRVLVTPQQAQANRSMVKATNAELQAIASGINHIVISHKSEWSMHPGMGADRVYDITFERPVLKRPLNESDKLVAHGWANYHPRFWRVVLMLDMHDGDRWYTDSVELITGSPVKLNDLTEFVEANWREIESRQNQKHIRGRRWEARIIKTHQRKKEKLDADNQ